MAVTRKLPNLLEKIGNFFLPRPHRVGGRFASLSWAKAADHRWKGLSEELRHRRTARNISEVDHCLLRDAPQRTGGQWWTERAGSRPYSKERLLPPSGGASRLAAGCYRWSPVQVVDADVTAPANDAATAWRYKIREPGKFLKPDECPSIYQRVARGRYPGAFTARNWMDSIIVPNA